MDSLFVIQGVDQGRRYTLDDSIITIGRDSSNKIRLRDPEASRRHAEISVKDSGRIITDLESSNGVFVNGRRVQTTRLVNGDQIQIGKTSLLFASRTLDSAATQEPLVDVFQETDPSSRILHALAPEDARRLFERSTEDKVREAWLSKARAHLNFMYHATLAASRTLDVERLLDRILELIFQWAPVDRGCIFLYDADDDKLIAKSSRMRKEGGRVKVSQTILNYAFRNQKGVLTSNARNDERWDGAASVFQTGVKEAICVPMQGRYGLVGVIYIDVSKSLADEVPTEAPNACGFYSPKETADSDSLELSDKSQNFIDQNNAFTTSSSKLTSATATPNLDSSSFDENLLVEAIGDNFEITSNNNIKCHPNPQETVDPQAEGEKTNDEPSNKKLTIDHLKLMVAIGRQAALAVEDTQYYQGMAQAERLAAIGQTVAVLSHHIKNILQGIRGGSFLIQTGLKDHDENLIGKGWHIVEKNQTKISDLVLDMLTFSKERTPVWSFADFSEVMADVVELMRGRAIDLEVDLIFIPDPSIPKFYFDKEQIHRAVVNLIGNALEASKDYDPDIPHSLVSSSAETLEDIVPAPKFPRGRVTTTVRFNKEKQQVSVIVDDVGPGVPIEIRNTLFRPFASKNKSGGTGLGLAVTHKIVQEHKGKISVQDSPLGGARFVVELPLVLEKPNAGDN